jgi:WhiB family redox-sensing transcriptional regulator
MTMMLERPAERARRGPRAASPVSVTRRRPVRDWLPEAGCREEDPELFYEYGSSTSREQAKAVCWGCPVRELCFDEVMAQEAGFGGSAQQNEKYRYGVRGGYTSTERWELAYPEEAAARREREERKKAEKKQLTPAA